MTRAFATRPRARSPARRSPLRAPGSAPASTAASVCRRARPISRSATKTTRRADAFYLMRRSSRVSSRSTTLRVHTHIDRCLGCRACETACPSGVPYGALLEATRATLGEVKRPPLRARLILALFARRRVMRIAVGARATAARAPGFQAARRAFPAISASPSRCSRPANRRSRTRAHDARGDGSRGTFALLRGCVMEGLFTRANRATERTLVANDYAAVEAPEQHCCGALHAHAGDLETARTLARKNIAAFEKSGRRVRRDERGRLRRAVEGIRASARGRSRVECARARLLLARARRERAPRRGRPAPRRAAVAIA